MISKTDALIENAIEVTWMLERLIEFDEIKSWYDLINEFSGTDRIKQHIKAIAKEFEEKYPFDTIWDNSDYHEEIKKFSKERLVELFGNQNEPDMIDGITTCCGYDFGLDKDIAKYCPKCGKKLLNIV